MGQFIKGQAKPVRSGRKKGTPNKKSELLWEIFDANDFSVPERLIELLPNLPPQKQADVLLELMSYVYPKRKALEMPEKSSIEDNTIEVIFVNPEGERSQLPISRVK